jgi:hypothetical protein
MIDLPEFQYWVTGTSLYLAGSFAFAIVVGVAGLRDKVSEKALVACLVVAACLSCFAWLTAARQEKDNADLKHNIVRIADGLNIDSSLSAKRLSDEILKRLPPRYPLTDAEGERLAAVLAATPTAERFAVEIYWPQLNGTHVYADTFATVFTANQWDAKVKMAGLINGHGLTFAVSKKVADQTAPMPMGAVRLMTLLHRANVPFAVGGVDNATDDIFAFVVGQPQAPQQ